LTTLAKFDTRLRDDSMVRGRCDRVYTLRPAQLHAGFVISRLSTFRLAAKRPGWVLAAREPEVAFQETRGKL